MAVYWPSFFCILIGLDEIEVNKKGHKKRTPIYSHLDQTSLVKRGFIIWPERELDFLPGPTREIPSGQDGPILLAWVAN